MDVTFLIGNGFDINFGLKTRYEEFLPAYIETPSLNDNIMNFKKNIDRNLSNWSDVEIEFGNYTANYSDGESMLFREALIDFSRCFSDYLKQENEKLLNEKILVAISKRIVSGLIYFHNHLRAAQQSTVMGVFTAYSNEYFNYNFINFNYTFLLDQATGLIDRASVIHNQTKGEAIKDKINKPVHIHGTYAQDMLIGINDESQMANKSFLEERRLTQLFIKPQANLYGKTSIHNTCEKLINNSRIIVIFGMSLGKTDAVWWKTIINWLRSEGNRQLVIFQYRKNYVVSLRESFVDCVEDVFQLLQDYGLTAQIRSSVEDRIHIAISNDLLGQPII